MALFNWKNDEEGDTPLSASNLNKAQQMLLDEAGGVIDRAIIEKIYPVGSIIMNVNNINPGDYIPNTTWIQYAEGKTIVGVDSNDSDFDTVEKTGGEKAHQLTIDEMPSHNHATSTWNYYSGDRSNGNKIAGTMDAADGGHTIYTSGAGRDKAHNNMQPYITTYIWKRTK